MTVLFVQTTQLATGRTYDVSFNNYDMTDLAGNALYSGGCFGGSGCAEARVKGGVKVDQLVAGKVLDIRGVWRLERSGRRHTPRARCAGGGWVWAAVRGWRDRACACSA